MDERKKKINCDDFLFCYLGKSGKEILGGDYVYGSFAVKI